MQAIKRTALIILLGIFALGGLCYYKTEYTGVNEPCFRRGAELQLTRVRTVAEAKNHLPAICSGRTKQGRTVQFRASTRHQLAIQNNW